jgi:putative Holliday junction resolvase
VTTHKHQTSNIVALDVGEKRIGVATASAAALLAHPYLTIKRTDQVMDDIIALLDEQRAMAVVIGRPRGLQGQNTAQTRLVEEFGHQLELHLKIPIYWQDEALTSKQAEAELEKRGKPYQKGDIDALAATYILEDFLHEHRGLVT